MKTSTSNLIFFLAPNFLGFLLFTLGPVLGSFLLSFYAWDLFTPARFVGGANYAELLRVDFCAGIFSVFFFLLLLGSGALLAARLRSSRWLFYTSALLLLSAAALVITQGIPWNPKFWQSIWNTFILLLGLPLGMIGSLLLASLLNEKIFGNQFFRLIYFLPSIVGGVGIYLLWKWIFNPDIGPINLLLRHIFGLQGPAWFESSSWAKPAMILMNFWGQVGGTNMILYLAALQSVDPGLHEAAKIDGANGIQRFRHITLPMVSSTSFFILVMGLIHGFQGGFDSAFVITRGGPAGATTTVNYFIYETAFQHFEMGLASAASMLLFVMVLGLSWVNWKCVSGKVHYT